MKVANLSIGLILLDTPGIVEKLSVAGNAVLVAVNKPVSLETEEQLISWGWVPDELVWSFSDDA